jgi:glucosamine--fructose-6-phosphate aminotransferase (isomerizing)
VCGIIGYVGNRPAKELLLQGLQRLEYRGYDSAGIALREDGGLEYVRAVGNLQFLKDAAGPNGSISSHGLGHTRWATHGGERAERASVDGLVRTVASPSSSTASSRTIAS